MKIIPLSEGSFTIDKTKVFIPFDKDKDKLQERPAGSLLVEIQPFVVITKEDIIILDTGLGFLKDGVLQIHKSLLNNNIKPENVTRVLLSHLHKDHAGGISKGETKTDCLLSFPNALYYINKKEFEYASEKGMPSYQLPDFNILRTSSQLIMMEENAGYINDKIYFETAGGHTPYLTVFWIREDEDVIFFGGDVASQLQQMKNRFIAKYDFDGKKSMELRSQWWEESMKDRWTFLFYHDIKTPELRR